MNYAETIDRIRRLAKGEDCCNDELYALLSAHGCHYLISKSQKYASRDKITIAINGIIQKKRYQFFKEVIEDLNLDDDHVIRYAHIKGAALSQRIYGSPVYRFSGDIDLLVSEKYSEIVKSILIKNGFVQGKLEKDKIIPYNRKELIFQKSFSHQLAAFIKATGDELCQFINIDVNLDIFWGESELKIDIDEFISNTEPFEIYDVKFNRLKTTWEFISLCMHHYKDMNSIFLIADRGFILSEYCDIYFYLINVSPSADELANIAKKYRVNDYVYYCIYYANEIFNDERLDVYLVKLKSESAHTLVDCYGLTETERRKWDTPFYERLLDGSFREKFYSALTNKERQKVLLNREFM